MYVTRDDGRRPRAEEEEDAVDADAAVFRVFVSMTRARANVSSVERARRGRGDARGMGGDVFSFV